MTVSLSNYNGINRNKCFGIDLYVEKMHDAHLHNLIDNKITLARNSRANLDSFIGHANVIGVCTRIAVDGDGLDSHFTARLDHTTGNLPSVSNAVYWHPPRMSAIERSFCKIKS